MTGCLSLTGNCVYILIVHLKVLMVYKQRIYQTNLLMSSRNIKSNIMKGQNNTFTSILFFNYLLSPNLPPPPTLLFFLCLKPWQYIPHETTLVRAFGQIENVYDVFFVQVFKWYSNNNIGPIDLCQKMITLMLTFVAICIFMLIWGSLFNVLKRKGTLLANDAFIKRENSLCIEMKKSSLDYIMIENVAQPYSVYWFRLIYVNR